MRMSPDTGFVERSDASGQQGRSRIFSTGISSQPRYCPNSLRPGFLYPWLCAGHDRTSLLVYRSNGGLRWAVCRAPAYSTVHSQNQMRDNVTQLTAKHVKNDHTRHDAADFQLSLQLQTAEGKWLDAGEHYSKKSQRITFNTSHCYFHIEGKNRPIHF